MLFTALVSLALAVLSRLIEQPRQSRSSSGFLAKYTLFVGYYAAPLAGLPLLSPLGAVRLLLEGVPSLEALLAFVAPAVLLAVLAPFVVRLRGEDGV